MERIQYSAMTTPVGTVHVVSSEKGLCRVLLPRESLDDLLPWFSRYFPAYNLAPGEALNQQALSELREYFAGQRRNFTVPLDVRGTEFQKKVWAALALIPYGETRSYQDLATQVGNTQACRAVGLANGANPIPIILPCHRVIGKNGSLVGYGGGLDLKTALLKIEGIDPSVK